LVHDWSVAGRPLRALASARLGHVSGGGSVARPRVGFQSEVLPGLASVRASAGLAFRPPTFDDLFWPARASAAGNLDLDAETSRDADAGISLTGMSGRAHVALDAFVREVNDLIQWAPGAAGIWRPQNIGRAHLAGFEAEGRVEAPLAHDTALHLSATLAHLSSRDDSGEPNVDGRELPYRPEWTAAAGAIVAKSTTEIEAFYRRIADVWVTRANTKRLAGYGLFDLRARAQVLPGVTMDFALLNLFDRPARDFRDFPLPGRTWELGFTFQGAEP
jgi:outer membrane cobalamin receptor